METLYQRTAERLWEKLEAHKESLDFSCFDGLDKIPFPQADVFAESNPLLRILVKEVETQFEYGMCVTQCSWAVLKAYTGNMDRYNRDMSTCLQARA
ncbi:hypothetical protein H8D36_07140 [archaeon]|nr:hypothetical protein [archaeon]